MVPHLFLCTKHQTRIEATTAWFTFLDIRSNKNRKEQGKKAQGNSVLRTREGLVRYRRDPQTSVSAITSVSETTREQTSDVRWKRKQCSAPWKSNWRDWERHAAYCLPILRKGKIKKAQGLAYLSLSIGETAERRHRHETPGKEATENKARRRG